MNRDTQLLAQLAGAATSAQREEITFRDNIGREIDTRERARQYAFRRLLLGELMLQAARASDDEDNARYARPAHPHRSCRGPLMPAPG